MTHDHHHDHECNCGKDECDCGGDCDCGHNHHHHDNVEPIHAHTHEKQPKIKIPKVIGHRGAASYAPENTIESIHSAADMGIKWVELDVKITKDEVPIIFHDEEISRTTNSHGLIAELTYDEIKELDAGSWFAESFLGAKIPTLEMAIDALIERNLGLNLEIKPCPGREKLTAEVVLDELTQIWDDHSKILLSSFQNVSLEVCKDMAHGWATGLILPEEWPENWEDIIKYLNPATVNINGNTCTREQVEDLMDLEKQILAYTINDPMRARELQTWGVDGFFSDEPDVIIENLLKVN